MWSNLYISIVNSRNEAVMYNVKLLSNVLNRPNAVEVIDYFVLG